MGSIQGLVLLPSLGEDSVSALEGFSVHETFASGVFSGMLPAQRQESFGEGII